MEDSDEEHGGFQNPREDGESLMGYESATDNPNRRKMESETEQENTGNKKLKKDVGQKNQKGKKEKDKNKDGGSKGGLFGDGWQINKAFKTFFIEPKDDKTKPLHIMEIAKLLNNIKVKYAELNKAGKNRFKITFDNPKHAETLINSKILTEQFNYKVFVPTMFKETIGVVRNVPPTISEKEILENLECERIKITKVERIQKMVQKELVPTYAIKIYAEGEKLPRDIKIFGLNLEVDVYVYPVKFCWRCVRYGHKSNACKAAQVRCFKCSDAGHEGKDCLSLNINCLHCKEGHKAFDQVCGERKRQNDINRTMAYNKLTYLEAVKRYPNPSQTQFRLQNRDFPSLLDSGHEIVNSSQPNHTNNNNNTVNHVITNTQTESNHPKEYITKTELTLIVNQLKTEIVKQLNITKLLIKIKEIQETITTSIDNSNNQSDNHQLLLNINKQLDEIINPEIIQNPKPPNI